MDLPQEHHEEWPTLPSSPSSTHSAPLSPSSSQQSFQSAQSYFSNTRVQPSWAKKAVDPMPSPQKTPAILKSRSSSTHSASREAPKSSDPPSPPPPTMDSHPAYAGDRERPLVSLPDQYSAPPPPTMHGHPAYDGDRGHPLVSLPGQSSITTTRALDGRRMMSLQQVEAGMRAQAQSPAPASPVKIANGGNNVNMQSVKPVVPTKFEPVRRRGVDTFSMATSAGPSNRANGGNNFNNEPLAQTAQGVQRVQGVKKADPKQAWIRELAEEFRRREVGTSSMETSAGPANGVDGGNNFDMQPVESVVPAEFEAVKLRGGGPSSMGNPAGPSNRANGGNNFDMSPLVQVLETAAGMVIETVTQRAEAVEAAAGLVHEAVTESVPGVRRRGPGASSMGNSAGPADGANEGGFRNGPNLPWPASSNSQRRRSSPDHNWHQQPAILQNAQPQQSLSQATEVELEAWRIFNHRLALHAGIGLNQTPPYPILGEPVAVKVPIEFLRDKVNCEIGEHLGSNGRTGHILSIGFLNDDEESGITFVHLDNDNWHRILDSVRGPDFDFFAGTWKEYLTKAPSEELSLSLQCTICKREDPRYYSRGVNPDELDVRQRPWTFRHMLRGHPSVDGTGWEIIADWYR